MKDLISSRDIMCVLITVSVSFHFLVEMEKCVGRGSEAEHYSANLQVEMKVNMAACKILKVFERL